ncbi:MAG: hypothetical protein ACP5F3_04400, partial [Candidatus Syntrophosphaera sp.]
MYQVSQKDGVFHILKDGMPVYTPAGNPLTTENKALAQKIVDDCEKFVINSSNWQSIVQYHFTMLDFFRHYPRQSIEQQLILNFDPYNDWTLKTPKLNAENLLEWQAVFGTAETRIKEGRAWITSLNLNQLCAAMVLGKTMGSMNIAYLVSKAGCNADLD